MKTCTKCDETKPISEFYKHPRSRDRRQNACKKCVCSAARKRRRLNSDVQAYDRARAKTPDRKRKAREITRRWREDNPDRYKAQTAVSNATRDGRLQKEPCIFCGTTKNLHAHHDDYVKLLDVVWLCAKCHHRLHALEK